MSLGDPAPTRRRGFTLIELLVVVLIIGILAAIALPRFLGQRTRAKNSAAQAAARHALLAARSYYTQNSESYVGLGPTQLQGYESSLGASEPADGVRPGDAAANPQNIWIGNGLDGTNPNTVAAGDPNGGSTVTLCSVSRGDTVYCVKDTNGVATYLATSGSTVGGAAGGSFSATGWSLASAAPSSPPSNTGVPTVSSPAVAGTALNAGNGSWSNAPTSYSYQWQQCNASGASCGDVSGATSASYTPGDADVGATFRVQVTASNGAGASASAATSAVSSRVVSACGNYCTAVLGTSGLTNYWRLDEGVGTTLFDRKGSANGSYQNGVALRASGPTLSSDTSTAASFDGTNDFASIPLDLSAVGSFTVEFWLYKPSYANDDDFAMEFDYGGNTRYWYINPNESGGYFRFLVSTQSNNYNDARVVRPATGWHHVAMVVNLANSTSTMVTPYFDGSAASYTKISSFTLSGNFINSTLYLMARQGPAPGLYTDGKMKDVAFYNTPLSAATISAHWAAR